MKWLEEESFVERFAIPFPPWGADIKVKRVAFIKICGNTGKHNFTRLSRNVKKIVRILSVNGIPITEEQGYLLLPGFYERFHDDVFNYLSTLIAEFLNNIRLGIYQYLKPVFDHSYMREPFPSLLYRYEFPTGCVNDVVKDMYWDLMNKVRAGLFMPRFTTHRYLRDRY